jgi:hypothetical protein
VYLYAGYPYSFYPAQHVQLPPTFDLARFTKRDIVPNDAGAFDTSPRHNDELHISTKYITAKLTDCNLGFDQLPVAIGRRLVVQSFAGRWLAEYARSSPASSDPVLLPG